MLECKMADGQRTGLGRESERKDCSRECWDVKWQMDRERDSAGEWKERLQQRMLGCKRIDGQRTGLSRESEKKDYSRIAEDRVKTALFKMCWFSVIFSVLLSPTHPCGARETPFSGQFGNGCQERLWRSEVIGYIFVVSFYPYCYQSDMPGFVRWDFVCAAIISYNQAWCLVLFRQLYCTCTGADSHVRQGEPKVNLPKLRIVDQVSQCWAAELAASGREFNAEDCAVTFFNTFTEPLEAHSVKFRTTLSVIT